MSAPRGFLLSTMAKSTKASTSSVGSMRSHCSFSLTRLKIGLAAKTCSAVVLVIRPL